MKGLTSYISFLDNDSVACFTSLQERHGLERIDFHRYLQVRSYIGHECKLIGFSDVESEFIRILKSAFSSIPTKSISKWYSVLSHIKNEDTMYVKEKWEREAEVEISEEDWEEIWNFQCTTTSSMDWREHCWKNIIRYFKTPYQEKYKAANLPCWRQCGSMTANHFHVFWDCPKLNSFWKEIQSALDSVYHIQTPLCFKTLYLGHVNFLESRSDIKLLQILLVASKKAITRRWMTPLPPTVEDWIGIILEIYNMEKLTYLLRTQKQGFYQIWSKWTTFIAPTRADFV